MIGTPASLPKSGSFWSRAWRFLQAFDEALHTTETDRLAARVDRLERQLRERNAQNANQLEQTETGHD